MNDIKLNVLQVVAIFVLIEIVIALLVWVL
jgi:hypothetical protein